MPITFVYFISKPKLWWTLRMFSLLSESQVVLFVQKWSNYDVLEEGQHHCHLLDVHWKQWVCHRYFMFREWLPVLIPILSQTKMVIPAVSKWWLCFIPPEAWKPGLGIPDPWSDEYLLLWVWVLVLLGVVCWYYSQVSLYICHYRKYWSLMGSFLNPLHNSALLWVCFLDLAV